MLGRDDMLNVWMQQLMGAVRRWDSEGGSLPSESIILQRDNRRTEHVGKMYGTKRSAGRIDLMRRMKEKKRAGEGRG